MLVLTRKDEEGVSLDMPDGRRIRLFIEVVGANKAKICIDAPGDVQIGRLGASKPRRNPVSKSNFHEPKEFRNGK